MRKCKCDILNIQPKKKKSDILTNENTPFDNDT